MRFEMFVFPCVILSSYFVFSPTIDLWNSLYALFFLVRAYCKLIRDDMRTCTVYGPVTECTQLMYPRGTDKN